MTVIHPPVKPNPRVPIRAWLASGCLVECGDRVDDVRRNLPVWVAVLALVIGALIGWAVRR